MVLVQKKIENNRLPRNFHKTFKPERQYINAMLKFAGSGKAGDIQTIGENTGIPTGASSGKVPAILDYCRGMGLIKLSAESKQSRIKYPELTHFGRIVLLEDPFLKLSITQWIAHFNMCRPLTGADVWYQTFFYGSNKFQGVFSRERLESHLNLVYGTLKKGLIGPLISMYEDESSFKKCGALSANNGIISRKSAPITDELGRGYGAWLLQLISDHFPKQRQVSLNELENEAGLKSIPFWTISSLISLLEILEIKSLISVDRHMEPWLIQPIKKIDEAWRNIYFDMI